MIIIQYPCIQNVRPSTYLKYFYSKITELKYICKYLFSPDMKSAFLLYTVILMDCKELKSGISWKGFLLFQHKKWAIRTYKI